MQFVHVLQQFSASSFPLNDKFQTNNYKNCTRNESTISKQIRNKTRPCRSHVSPLVFRPSSDTVAVDVDVARRRCRCRRHRQYSDFMHFIICLSHVSIYGPLAVTICNHVSPTTRALPEAHSLEVFVCVSVRVCVATFSGMTPLLEQATVTGNGQRKTTAPTSTLLQFELRLRLQLPVFIIWPCHLYAPLGL